jgi:hypothetical protein
MRRGALNSNLMPGDAIKPKVVTKKKETVIETFGFIVVSAFNFN